MTQQTEVELSTTARPAAAGKTSWLAEYPVDSSDSCIGVYMHFSTLNHKQSFLCALFLTVTNAYEKMLITAHSMDALSAHSLPLTQIKKITLSAHMLSRSLQTNVTVKK